MYRYTPVDSKFIEQRVAEYRGQVQRRLAGELTEDQFRPLRLMNGLYLQRHAYMLRIAVPYGLLSSAQMRKFGYISETYDRGFGHFTTRQNLQYNWIKLADTPDILTHLAEVEMNSIQTSGNCVRNITADPLAGVAADELVDVRPYCEVLRQYFALHPEFMYLPRKFKLAVSGAAEDRAATMIHDIGLRAVERDGRIGFRVIVGGGLGRTPKIGKVIHEFIEPEDLITYCEAILRVYNLYGRRDNKFKARIKILVDALGTEKFREEVDAEWEVIRHERIHTEHLDEMKAYFAEPEYDEPSAGDGQLPLERAQRDPGFARWLEKNVTEHRFPGYSAVYVSLKRVGIPPGDVFTAEFYALADLMDRYNRGVCSAVYNQNLLFQHIRNSDLEAVYDALNEMGMARPNIKSINDMICCPGLDYCALANASSIPLATALLDRFQDLDELFELGDVQIKMSGCINACGHHHIGHIGILGVNKRGQEYYQIAIGGSAGSTDDDEASVGHILGASVPHDAVVEAVEKIMDCYLAHRQGRETFLQTVRRVGPEPFKESLYEAA